MKPKEKKEAQIRKLREMAVVVNLHIHITAGPKENPLLEIYNKDNERLYVTKTRRDMRHWIEGYNCCMNELSED